MRGLIIALGRKDESNLNINREDISKTLLRFFFVMQNLVKKCLKFKEENFCNLSKGGNSKYQNFLLETIKILSWRKKRTKFLNFSVWVTKNKRKINKS